MSARREASLWLAQRATAMVLAICVVVHLATIIYAVRAGLSAEQVLGRTRGSVGWAVFYGTFVIASAIHGAIGLRAIMAEWLRWSGDAADLAMTLVGGALVVAGLRAVFAVVAT